MPSLELTVAPLELPLVHTFTIARSSESIARTALVRLRWGTIEALGESSPSPRYNESVESVMSGLHARTLGDDPYALDALLDGLPPAQRCGLDVALHDCIGKDVDRPLWRLLGLDPTLTPLTSFTIGIAIVTDEDSKDANDLLALAGCVDGINVKLVKCGGIRGALEMIHTARALNLKVMLGCMVESAILSTAAAHLSPLVDWADLDGPFLVARDPFAGMTYDAGQIVLPAGPGLGVVEKAPAG